MENTVSVAKTKRNVEVATTEARKKDALALAELIYDMFKEEEQRENSTIEVSDD